MSNNTVKYNSTPTFSGSGWAVNAVSGCVASSGHCSVGVQYNYNMLPATNPLNVLDAASFNSLTGPVTKPCGGNVTNGQTCSLSPSAGGVYSDLKVNAGGTVNFAAGTYFFYNATISFGGTVTGTDVTFVLLGNSNFSISSSAIVNLSAPAKNAAYPALSGVLIDDQAPNKSANAVTVNGNGTVKLDGAMYFPNVDVNWGGTAQTDTGCSMVLANTITITGNTYMSTGNCAPGTIAHSQVVALVQ
jgi:hypothetical protein